MKICVIKFGKPRLPEYERLSAVFAARLKGVWTVDSLVINDKAKPEKQLAQFKAYIQQQGSCGVIGLDERGRQLTSPELAAKLESWRSHWRNVVFVVGGPYGLLPEVQQRLNFSWALGAGVLPSDLAWTVVWEQVYRAMTIQLGHPYHHGG